MLSIVIPLEQGLRQLGQTLILRRFHSIVIPLEQGLRHLSPIKGELHTGFYCHSIRTRIKTEQSLQGEHIP